MGALATAGAAGGQGQAPWLGEQATRPASMPVAKSRDHFAAPNGRQPVVPTVPLIMTPGRRSRKGLGGSISGASGLWLTPDGGISATPTEKKETPWQFRKHRRPGTAPSKKATAASKA